MEKNRRWLIIAVCVIAGAALIGVGVIQYFRLDNPVFFENYCSYRLNSINSSSSRTEFMLDYAANIDDKRTVTAIKFPEADGAEISFYASDKPNSNSVYSFFSSNQKSNEKTLGRYAVRTVYVTAVPYKTDITEPIILTKAEITYNNNEKQDVSFGSIELIPYGATADYIHSSKSGTSGPNGKGSYVYTTESYLNPSFDVTLVDIESTQLPYIKDHVKIKLNGKDYSEISGMVLNYGDRINFTTKLDIPYNDNFTRYNVALNIRYKGETGTEYVSEIDSLNSNPTYTDFWGLVKYLKSRGQI